MVALSLKRLSVDDSHLLCCLYADGDLAAVYKERQQVQEEVWAAATAETVRATLAAQFPDLTHRTVVTLNNAAPAAAAEEGEPVVGSEKT